MKKCDASFTTRQNTRCKVAASVAESTGTGTDLFELVWLVEIGDFAAAEDVVDVLHEGLLDDLCVHEQEHCSSVLHAGRVVETLQIYTHQQRTVANIRTSISIRLTTPSVGIHTPKTFIPLAAFILLEVPTGICIVYGKQCLFRWWMKKG